jgi:PBSX family phage terminase large subunit
VPEQPAMSPKQLEFITKSTKKWNLAHGAVRTGKTVCTLFRFMQAAWDCPDSKIFIVGHTFDTAYRNVIRLLLESPELSMFRPYCTWSGKKLYFRDKTIIVLGAKDEGAIGNFQGDTYSLVYCDEMTLYPIAIIQMIDSRLSKSHSKGFAAMNPSHPSHLLKNWIDEYGKGNKDYYALHFSLDDNPYIEEEYKNRIRTSSSGLFFKRNVLGLWVMAEGAIFEFFDKNVHVVDRPPIGAEYWIAGIDFGSNNPCACVLIGVNTGRNTQTGKQMWVEDEYYWDHSKQRQKVNSELADDIASFLQPYGVKELYIDPSAHAFQVDLQRRGLHPVHADNDVKNGIQRMCDYVRNGVCVVCKNCKNLIREIEGYVWDPRQAKKGYDEPLKENDHLLDALRYALYTHKAAVYDPYKERDLQQQFAKNKYQMSRNF